MATPGLGFETDMNLPGFENPTLIDRTFTNPGGSTTTKQPEIGEPDIAGGFSPEVAARLSTGQLRDFGVQETKNTLGVADNAAKALEQQVKPKAAEPIGIPETGVSTASTIIDPAKISAIAEPVGIAETSVATTSTIAEPPAIAEAEAKKKTEKAVEEVEAPVFTFINPLTGETEEFDSPEKKTKREKQINEEIVDAEQQDQLKQIGQDFTTQSASVMLDLANPDTPDPIKTAQLNELIASFGPENQAAMDSMLLSLKQDGLAGSGAGNAMLLLMARGNNAQFSNMVQRLNTESAQRIVDMNKFGAEIGLRIRQQVNNEVQQKFQNDATKFGLAVEAGDFTSASNLASDMGLANLDMAKFEAMSDIELAGIADTFFKNVAFSKETADKITEATGITFDPKQYASIPAAIQETINNRLDSIDQLPTAEAKKQAMLALAQEFPETFGFPDDPESAVAMVNEMDFDNVAANAQALADATNFWRTEAITDSPNLEGVIAAGTGAWSSSSDGQIDNLFNSQVPKFDLLTEESQALILDGMAQFGVNSTDDIDTREEKEAFLSLSRFDDQRQDVGGISAEIFENFGTIFQDTDLANWFDGTDATKESISKQWIAENIVFPGKFKTDPETGQLVPDVEGLAPPWSDESSQYTFLTWPRKVWDEEGNVAGTSYEGQEFRDDLETDSVFNTPEEISEDQRLTNTFMDYKKNNDTGLNWLEWYNESQGGTKKIEAAFDPVDAPGIFLDEALVAFDAGLESGDLSALTDDQFSTIFNNDPEALTRLIRSGNVRAESKEGLGGIERATDFHDSGLKAGSVVSEDSSGKKGEDTGAGEGNGSIIIYQGRPMRITSYLSDWSEGSFTDARPDRRRGILKGVFLDGDPLGREPIIINEPKWVKKGPLA